MNTSNEFTNAMTDAIASHFTDLLKAEWPRIMQTMDATCEKDDTFKVSLDMELLRRESTMSFDLSLSYKTKREVSGEGSTILMDGTPVMKQTDLFDGEVITVELIVQAEQTVRETRRATHTILQRRLNVSFGAADMLLSALEERGIVSASDYENRREVLVAPEREDSNG